MLVVPSFLLANSLILADDGVVCSVRTLQKQIVSKLFAKVVFQQEESVVKN